MPRAHGTVAAYKILINKEKYEHREDHLHDNRRSPALATYSFLPIVKAFTKAADIVVETRDISWPGEFWPIFRKI